jgi:hypothetical protein
MAMDKAKEFKVGSVGTLAGNPVIWVYGPDMREYVVPTTVVVMAKLAADGARIRNER